MKKSCALALLLLSVTPAVAGDVNVSGTLTANGPTVINTATISWPSTSDTHQATIGGLPYKVSNYSNGMMLSSSTTFTLLVQPDATNHLYVSASGYNGTTNASMSSAFMILTATYETTDSP